MIEEATYPIFPDEWPEYCRDWGFPEWYLSWGEAPAGCWEPDGWDGWVPPVMPERVAHLRKLYEKWYGPIPVGMYVVRRCENPACWRPDHFVKVAPGDHVEVVFGYSNDQDKTEKLYRTMLGASE